jgi:hypothetical protein
VWPDVSLFDISKTEFSVSFGFVNAIQKALAFSSISDFCTTGVSKTDGRQPIERQLYGTSKAKIFLLPVSSYP